MVAINAMLSKKMIPIIRFHKTGSSFRFILANTDSGRKISKPDSIATAAKAGVIFLKLSKVFSTKLSKETLIFLSSLSKILLHQTIKK